MRTNDIKLSINKIVIVLEEKQLRNKYRSSHRRCSVRKGVLRNFVKLTGKHLCQSLFFNKAAGLCNFIKKETMAQVFSCKFCESPENTFFIELLRATATASSNRCLDEQ